MTIADNLRACGIAELRAMRKAVAQTLDMHETAARQRCDYVQYKWITQSTCALCDFAISIEGKDSYYCEACPWMHFTNAECMDYNNTNLSLKRLNYWLTVIDNTILAMSKEKRND